jgi:hypothetical protein
MKKLLIGLLVMSSISAFAGEVLIIKQTGYSRFGNDGSVSQVYGDAKKEAINECTENGGVVTKSKCQKLDLTGSRSFELTRITSCAVVCSLVE